MKRDYQTSTVDGAAAFEAARCGGYHFDRYEGLTLADVYEPPEPEQGDTVQTFGDITFHKARKDHKDGSIKAGQRYAKIAYGGYVVGGARWLNSYKVALEDNQPLPDWHWRDALERGVINEEI